MSDIRVVVLRKSGKVKMVVSMCGLSRAFESALGGF